MYYVYILASGRNGTLYVGSSSELINRTTHHKEGVIEGFTEKYGVNKLVYFEETTDAHEMVKRERQLKAWKRKWKLELIEKNNHQWEDLYYQITESLDPESSSG